MKKHFRKILKWLKRIVIYFFALSILSVIFFRFVPVPFTFLMIQRCFIQAFHGEKIKMKKDWVSLDEMSPNIVYAVVAAEDQNFTHHFGFDFDAIKRAQKLNKKGKRIRGASTITMQTAKNVFLWPGRTYIRKGFEAYFTLLLEVFWSKERIVEVYLNVAEMGNGIYGVEAASMTYYGKHASKLTKSQAAMIATILPNPRKRNPSKPSGYMLKRQGWTLKQMNRIGKPDLKLK